MISGSEGFMQWHGRMYHMLVYLKQVLIDWAINYLLMRSLENWTIQDLVFSIYMAICWLRADQQSAIYQTAKIILTLNSATVIICWSNWLGHRRDSILKMQIDRATHQWDWMLLLHVCHSRSRFSHSNFVTQSCRGMWWRSSAQWSETKCMQCTWNSKSCSCTTNYRPILRSCDL